MLHYAWLPKDCILTIEILDFYKEKSTCISGSYSHRYYQQNKVFLSTVGKRLASNKCSIADDRSK